ncbi:MAG: hypothetical protein ACTSYQ_00120 [Candidatus Odinarchaeia archaeon]
MVEELEKLIEGLKPFSTEINLVNGDIELTFDLLYYLFNSLKTKRIFYNEVKEPFNAMFIFINFRNDSKFIIKVTGEKDAIFFNSWSSEEDEQYLQNKIKTLENISEVIQQNELNKLKKYLEILKLLDTTIEKIIKKEIIRSIYFSLANTREILYKINETNEFDPILFPITTALEKIRSYGEEEKLIDEEVKKLSLNVLKWKKYILGKIKQIVKVDD